MSELECNPSTPPDASVIGVRARSLEMQVVLLITHDLSNFQHLQSGQTNRRQQYTPCRVLEAHRALPLALGVVSSRTVAPIGPSAATTCIKVALCDVLGRTPRGLEQPADVRPGCPHATCSHAVFELNCCKINPAIPWFCQLSATADLRHGRISQSNNDAHHSFPHRH